MHTVDACKSRRALAAAITHLPVLPPIRLVRATQRRRLVHQRRLEAVGAVRERAAHARILFHVCTWVYIVR